jgi:hypothetical protein
MTKKQASDLRSDLMFFLKKIDSDVVWNLNDEDLELLEETRDVLEREAEPYL